MEKATVFLEPRHINDMVFLIIIFELQEYSIWSITQKDLLRVILIDHG